MPPNKISASADGLDLSPRIAHSAVVVGSPAAAAETIIASVTLPSNCAVISGVLLFGWCAYTVGTNGTGCTLRIRQTTVAGTIVAAMGATTVVAANLDEKGLQGLDTAPALPGQIYHLTMLITAGTAISTVSAVSLAAIII